MMSPQEKTFVIRKLTLGLDYRAKAEAMNNNQISKFSGYSKNAIKKITGPEGKSHPGYPFVMPFIRERDRYRSKAHEFGPEQVARSMGHPLEEVLEIYNEIREINCKQGVA